MPSETVFKKGCPGLNAYINNINKLFSIDIQTKQKSKLLEYIRKNLQKSMYIVGMYSE